MPSNSKGEWFDQKENRWLSVDGYEVCQDHLGPRAECPHNHGNRKA